jgi:4-amino-4-deoxy-L-arabinose transferase-like glycosyltransferase
MDKRPTGMLMVIAFVALAHAACFTVYQRPDWDAAWDDQVGYQRLGHILATTGKFTRNPDAQPFVPETIRTPAYPMFVALTYRIAGESHAAVAAAQALLFVLIVLAVYAMTARLATSRVALAAAGFTALFSPIPYYGALVLTEVLSTFFVTLAMWTAVRAVQDRRSRDFILTGVFIGLATLTRPSFAMFPIAIVGAVTLAALAQRQWRTVLPWGWMLVAFAIVLAPWLAYNVIYLQRLTLSPAGGIGRATWEASWQGTWPGRVQADLTRLVEAHIDDDDAALDGLVRQFAIEVAMPAEPMLIYVHQWRDFRRIWDTPTDPRERAAKRIEADGEYWRAGLANIARDRAGHVLRRLTVGTFVLWAAEIPIRYTDINNAPWIVVRAIWLVQVVLVLLAIVGVVMLAHRRGPLVAAPIAALLAYITVVHVPLLSEARYSLPAKPTLLALVAIALAELLHRALPQTGDYLP